MKGINRFGFAAAIALATLLAAGSSGFAATKKPITVKGKGVADFSTTNFSYDGKASAEIVYSTGKDNLYGTFNAQALIEYNPTPAGTCTTTADGTAGHSYDVVGSTL